MIDFEILRTHGQARTGRMRTRHGVIETPAFMPVGTDGVVKGVTPRDLRECGASILLANVYHLFLRPGIDVLRSLGGLHRFMAWDGPLLTDSGGYQVFSLAPLAKVRDDGVVFRSHLDGSTHFLRPEDVVELEIDMGVDVGMVLDVCVSNPARLATVESAVARTTAWANRSIEARRGRDVAMFGIVQGGADFGLRERSAREICALGFDGYAVGGLSVGESPATTRRVAEHSAAFLPAARPRYLMGVGRPVDLLDFMAMGYDLFDCVVPTRNGRNGGLFTWAGRLAMRNARYARDREPVDEGCGCYTCRQFTRGYLRHLAVTGDMLSGVLNTIHNIYFYLDLMKVARRSIAEGTLAGLRERVAVAYENVDEVMDAE